MPSLCCICIRNPKALLLKEKMSTEADSFKRDVRYAKKNIQFTDKYLKADRRLGNSRCKHKIYSRNGDD